jgi:hypothetical protein
MLVTGTGYDWIDSSIEGGIGTQWKINRVSDGVLMQSGSGCTADISFTGESVWYTLTFMDQYGAWGTPAMFLPQTGPTPFAIEINGCQFSYISRD